MASKSSCGKGKTQERIQYTIDDGEDAEGLVAVVLYLNYDKKLLTLAMS